MGILQSRLRFAGLDRTVGETGIRPLGSRRPVPGSERSKVYCRSVTVMVTVAVGSFRVIDSPAPLFSSSNVKLTIFAHAARSSRSNLQHLRFVQIVRKLKNTTWRTPIIRMYCSINRPCRAAHRHFLPGQVVPMIGSNRSSRPNRRAPFKTFERQ